MNAVVRALFDDAAITGAQAAGLKDTSTAAMRAAVREWFELFFMREAVKGKDEDPAQRIPYTITNKLTKACFAEYDSSFTENGTGKTAWLDGQRSLIDAEKQDVLQWVMVGGEGFLKPVPFPVSWTVKMKKKQKETQDILSYHTQAAGCSDKARAKASGGRQPIEECGRTGL